MLMDAWMNELKNGSFILAQQNTERIYILFLCVWKFNCVVSLLFFYQSLNFSIFKLYVNSPKNN